MNTHHQSNPALKVRLRTTAAVALATMAAVVPVAGAQAAAPTEERVRSAEYVPFVTDFPKPAASTAAAKPYVPFVTDFPQAAAQPVTEGGTDWSEIGSGAGAAIAVLLAASGLLLIRRARPAQS